jgi:mono/diheme cytochrome c family protein
MPRRVSWAVALGLAGSGGACGDAGERVRQGDDLHRAGADVHDQAAPRSVPAPWSDAWILADAERYLEDRAFRRERLEASLTNPDNMYSQARLGSYGLELGGWDALPEWVPVARPVTAAVVDALRTGAGLTLDEATPLWDGQRPQTLTQWVELGRRVFYEYPLRPEVFAEHALADPEVARRVGLRAAPDGTWPGVVVFADLDRRARVGITCALCHVALSPSGPVPGAARRDLDYGYMRLSFHRDTGAPLPARLAARMAEWGPGRADITQDDDEDPVAIPDLWGMRGQPFLTQAGTLRHDHPAALAIRQETQILQANRERTRPPRELAWALAMYVYSLEPPPRAPVVEDARVRAGRRTFEQACTGCHDHPTGGGVPVPAQRVGTDPTLALGRARGTGTYRPAPLVRVADAAPYLHHGAVSTLEDLLDPARLRDGSMRGTLGPGPVPGHAYGTELPATQRAELVAYLRTW